MIQILEAFQEAYRIGRNRPIDREILSKSEAISLKFMNGTNELLTKYGGDPHKLIQALERKELQSFRESSRHDLQQYLINHGYLTEEKPEDTDMIKARLFIRADRLGLDRRILERFFDRVSAGIQ